MVNCIGRLVGSLTWQVDCYFFTTSHTDVTGEGLKTRMSWKNTLVWEKKGDSCPFSRCHFGWWISKIWAAQPKERHQTTLKKFKMNSSLPKDNALILTMPKKLMVK